MFFQRTAVWVDSANISTTTDWLANLKAKEEGIRANLWWKHVVYFFKTISLSEQQQQQLAEFGEVFFSHFGFIREM